MEKISDLCYNKEKENKREGTECMNKKLRRLIQPRMALFFIVNVLFCVAAAILGQYILAGAEALVVLLMFIYYQWSNTRRKRALTEYVQTTNEMMRRSSDGEMPFPSALIQLGDGELIWYNKQFAALTQVRDSLTPKHISDVLPGFSYEWLENGKSECPDEFVYQDRRFQITGNVVPDSDGAGGILLGMLYFNDLTDLLQVRDEYIRSRPMVCIVLVDNYDEVMNNLTDAQISSLNADINTKINEWVDLYGGLLRKLERNRYLVLLEAKDLAGMAEDKFSLLETMRAVVNPSGIPATVSIGIGKDGADFRENYDFAALSIEMALSRGGDQTVIKDRYDFTFFGGRNTQSERRTKVKSRVMASSLSELIVQSSSIFIMGHKMADLDAVGAAAGVFCLCRAKGKSANIVIDQDANSAHALLDLLKTMPDYAECFMSGQDALLQADTKSLLIVVDTNRPDQVECKPLLESIRRVVVIDHHRRAADYIEQPVLNLHEPFASSASELVTELLQYTVENEEVRNEEATALLAGIALDTKHFSVRTTSRSFEAAAYLRRIGADPVEVKKLFKNDLRTMVDRYKIIQKAGLYRGRIAIAALDYPVTRIIAAQAADELLNISGIDASFVLFPQDDQTVISARSIGDANVQVILEPLGGGGNAATAGAQIKGMDVLTARDELIRSIDHFFEK